MLTPSRPANVKVQPERRGRRRGLSLSRAADALRDEIAGAADDHERDALAALARDGRRYAVRALGLRGFAR